MWADQTSRTFREAFAEMDLIYDDFIRTTEERHRERVQRYVRQLLDSDDVYRGQYEVWYDASQEEYVPEAKAKDAGYRSTVNGKPLVRKSEKNYFFRLSRYGEAAPGAPGETAPPSPSGPRPGETKSWGGSGRVSTTYP